MLAQAFNPDTQEAEADIKFKASLVYVVNFRLAGATSKIKQKTNKQKPLW